MVIDAVVTDKKKRYIQDLPQEEFHIFEDGVEQKHRKLFA